MSVTSLDLSDRAELGWVVELVRPVRKAAGGAPLFVVGAMARELVMVHGFGLVSGRATRDLDFAVRVAGWGDYDLIRKALINDFGFQPVEGIVHRLQSGSGLLLDMLPFGAIEGAGRTIAWPPDGDEVMISLGFAEVAETTIAVTLPDGSSVDVAGPMAQTVLKLVAWSDRADRSGSDAYDLTILLRNYLDTGHEDRLYDEAADLLDDPQFDREVAGATLLGQDIAATLGQETEKLRDLIAPETDSAGPLRLVGDLACDPEHGLRLVRGLARGLGVPSTPSANV